MLTCVLGEVSCERSLAFVFLSKNKSVIPGEVFDPPRDSSFAKEVFFRSTPSLLCQGGLHILTKPSLLRREGCNRPAVLFLPHLSLPCGRVLNPLPSPRPFQKGKGCNRPPVLRTATLYGCRTIKGLRRVVRDGTAWGKVDRIIEVLVLW